IRSTKIGITMTDEGVGTMYAGDKVESYGGYAWKIPDVLGYIQSKTELTRSTIEEILSKSNRIEDILINPQLFLDLRSEEHTSELQSRENLVCRLLLEKKNTS